MPEAIVELRERLAKFIDLSHAGAILDWDRQVMMPPRGGPQRAEVVGTIAELAHAYLIDPQTARLLERARAELDGADPGSDAAALVRKVARDYEKARRVPAELAAALARAAASAYEPWVNARAQDDFGLFAPYLERNLELTRRYVDCFDGFDDPYDAVLDDYDPGLTAAQAGRLLGELREALVPLIARLRERQIDTAPLRATFPVAAQRGLVREIVGRMGFDPQGWRLDDTVHPFATSFGSGDVRITTRFQEDRFAVGLYGAMHECGHGLYSEGVAPALARTPLALLDSLALHESQSRLWENCVGRSLAFSRFLAPRLAQASGGSLHDLEPATLFRAVNAVTPSLIRMEADEATYGLHIVLRFELERELLAGTLTVAQLPRAWNERMRAYLGVEVGHDRDGVLQDVHWSAGLIGYFPTYALGNLIAGQLWAKLHAELPDLDSMLAAGELHPLREWLRVNVHRHGAKLSSGELLQRVVGAPIQVGPFIDYLEAKLEAVYGVTLR